MKKICCLVLILITCISILNFCTDISVVVGVNELGSGFDYNNVPKNGSTDLTKIETPVKRIWSTVIYVLQISSIIGIIAVGLRYMFSSADQKADIKKSTIWMVIGIIMVFAGSTFVGFVIKAFGEIAGI